MNSANEFEAIQIARDRSSVADRRRVWQLDALKAREYRSHRRFDAIRATLGKALEPSPPTLESFPNF